MLNPQQFVPRRFHARGASSLKDQNGFTLVELLVVILIIGILAAIAIPSFIGQKTKALDAQAKELARTAATTAETVATNHDGKYDAVTVEALHNTEATILTAPNGKEAYLSAASGKGLEYSVTAKATDGDEYTITRNNDGSVSRECVSTVMSTGCSGERTSTW